MNFNLALLYLGFLTGCRAADEPSNRGTESVTTANEVGQVNCVVIPSPTNAVQFRLYTHAASDLPHLFNTFEIEAYGEVLLQSPGGDGLRRWLANSPSNAPLHNLLVNGAGPRLAPTNDMVVIDQASGTEWRYVALDASAAYKERLEQFKRGILFVEPDVFILYDHLVAREPSYFQMVLHPPAATGVDPVWGDLRLELPRAGFRIHAPAVRNKPRHWEHIESATCTVFPNTVTLQLGPAHKLAHLDLLTVFAILRGSEKKEFAFRLLESPNAIGARIHRDGLPTLVAFKTDPAVEKASLTGFTFRGPVGVDVFKPKPKALH